MLKLINGETITEEIKNQFKRSATNAYIKLNDGTILGSRNYIKSIKLENLRYNEETNKILGEAISKRVTLDLFNQENELNIENKEFELLIGAQINEPQRNPNLFNINDILLMSEQVSIDENDIITAIYDNSEGKEDKFLNVFTNITALLETSKKYYAVLEILEVSGTGGIYLTDSATEKESFNELSNGQKLKYRITTLDNFLKSDTVLKTYIKFLPGESGTIKFRISLFDISINLDNFIYKPFTEEYKYISFGNFIVQKPDNSDTKESTTLEAFDYMIKFNKPYISRVTYPCTYLELAQDVCDQCGVELGSKDFRNADKILTQNPFINGEHCRVVIKAIAREVAFSWARIREDNKLYFDFNINNSVAETITIDDYIELGNNDETIPVNTIILQDISIESENITIKNDELISEYGKQKELILKTEYFAFTQELRQEYISAAEALMGLVYYPVTLKGIGSIYLDNNDIISIENKKGNKLNTYCFDHIIDYNGVLHDDINSPAMTETETEYQHESQQDLDRRRTEIIVDKANQNIQILTEKKVNNDEIIARINMAILGRDEAEVPEDIEKSIIEILANKFSWKADYSEMSPDGILTLKGHTSEPYIYTLNDYLTMYEYMNGRVQISDELFELYDVNDDGEIDVVDYVMVHNILEGKISSTKYANVEITLNPKSSSEFLKITLAGQIQCRIGVNEIYNYSFKGMNMFLGTYADQDNQYGILMNGEKGQIKIENQNVDTETFIDAGKVDAYNVFASSGGGKGYCMHGINANHTYRCAWENYGNTNNFSVFVDQYKVPLIRSVEDNAKQISEMTLDINKIKFVVPNYGTYETGEVFQSDTKLKENIVDCKVNALEEINKIKHIEFDWKETQQALRTGHETIAYSANQIQEALGNDVAFEVKQQEGLEYDSLLQIDSNRLLPYITKAIQELSTENTKLKDTIDKQQKIIDFLINKLDCKDEISEILKEGE